MSMKKQPLITYAALLLIISASSADIAIQSDWSGGPAGSGAVSAWTDVFDSSSDIEYEDVSGEISLHWGKLTDASDILENSALYAAGAYPGDVDEDGDIDILVTSAVDNKVLWWENIDGSATSWISHPIASDLAGAWGAICADIDQDGDQDIFGSAMTADVVVWWENTDGAGTAWSEHTIDSSFDGAKAIIALDINEDGQIDVAGAAKVDNQVVWYSNDSLGTSWTKTVIVSDYSGANSVYPYDFDEDGDWDILSAAKTEEAIRWYENSDGSGTTWIEHSVAEGFALARTAEACDLDGDGDGDVLGTGGISKASGTVCWWENTDGSGLSWTLHIIEDEFLGPYTVLHSDLDGDGDQDVVSGSLTENAIYWWENTNSGSTWISHVLCNYFAPRTVSSADLDGDGSQEVFAGSLYSIDITWWRVFGYSSAGSLISCILDTEGDSDWGDLSWIADVPTATGLGVAMRSSWDVNDMGEWSDTVTTCPVDLSTLVSNNDRFIQYCVTMESQNWIDSPVLEQLQISWNPLSISGGETIGSNDLHVIGSNPAGADVSMQCILASDRIAELQVYDIAGRMVYSTGAIPMISGVNTFNLTDLSAGIYISRLVLPEETLSVRLTVLR